MTYIRVHLIEGNKTATKATNKIDCIVTKQCNKGIKKINI